MIESALDSPFGQRPRVRVQDVVAASNSQEAEVEHINSTEVSALPLHSPSQTLQTDNVKGSSALEVLIPEIDTSLLHPAVRDLGLNPMVGENLHIGGRLRYFLPNWQKLTQDSFILQDVQGLQIPFLTPPVQNSLPVQNTSIKTSILINTEVQDMLVKGAIKQVQPCKGQFLSPVFLVPKKDRGNRPVINLKKLNQNIEYQHFKMEGIQSV